jgi:hypothetical protein
MPFKDLIRERNSLLNKARPRTSGRATKKLPYGGQKNYGGYTMKKYSWIFALILALTMAFVFTACPSDPDPGPGPGPGPGELPEIPYEPDPDAPEIAVSFGTGPTDTEITVSAGEVTYAAGGYTYTYGSGANTNYGNALTRFSVDLGDFLLADYSGVSFTWTGVSGDAGLSPANPTYTKNLFLLASVNGADLTPYKSDGAIKELIVNTNYFVTNPGADIYAGAANVPGVKGTTPVDITMRIERSKALELTGEVWFSFYLHATDGAYTISNFKLIPYDPDFEEVFPPPPTVEPPPVIEEFPEGAVTFDLDLEDNDYTSGVSGADPVEEIDFADDVLTVTFTKNNERLIIGLTPAQIAMLNTQKNGDKIYVLIEGEVTDGTGDLFRYHIGDATAGSAWNGTTGSNDVLVPNGYKTLAEITLLELSFNSNRKFDHFILQHSGTDSVTIEISKITIGVMPPALNTWFYLDLEDWETDPDVVSATVPLAAFADGTVTVPFIATANQRINFKLSEAQKVALTNSFANSAPGLGNSVKVTIVGEVVAGSGTDGGFRYHIGDITSTGGWNATSGATPGTLTSILSATLTYDNLGGKYGGSSTEPTIENPDSTNEPNYFVFQHQPANAVTIEISSIRFDFVGLGGEITDLPPPPPPPDYIVDLTAATNSLTSDTLTGQYTGYGVMFPALTGFDISGYTKLTITASFEDYDSNVLVPAYFAGVKIGPSTNGQDAGEWNSNKYIDKSNLHTSTADMVLTVAEKGDLAAIATAGWGVWLQKNDSVTSGTGVAKITLTGVKFHN